MKKAHFSVGDKIKVLSKSVPKYLTYDCTHQGMVGYIVGIKGDGSGRDNKNCLVVRDKKGYAGGDFFAPQDLEKLN